jgi:hypothetical protein
MPVNKAVGHTRETGREVAQVNGKTRVHSRLA